MNNPTCLHTFVISARMPLENIPCPFLALQSLSQTNAVYLNKILLLNSPNRENGPISPFTLAKLPITSR